MRMLTVFRIMSKQMQSNKENEKLMRTNECATIISVSVFIRATSFRRNEIRRSELRRTEKSEKQK